MWIALCDLRCSPDSLAPALNCGIFLANTGKMYVSCSAKVNTSRDTDDVGSTAIDSLPIRA